MMQNILGPLLSFIAKLAKFAYTPGSITLVNPGNKYSFQFDMVATSSIQH